MFSPLRNRRSGRWKHVGPIQQLCIRAYFMDLIHLNYERKRLRQMHIHAEGTKPIHVILNRRAYQRSFEVGLDQQYGSKWRND